MKPLNKKLQTKLYGPVISGPQADLSRRRFLQGSSALVAGVGLSLPLFSPLLRASQEGALSPYAGNPIMANPLGFNGERKDPVTGLYHLGNGYRVYNPALMRFHACDSMSPFGKGGINSYAYCLGDPINLRDPSGHFALMSMLIGAIIGAVVGAAISATAEGIRAAVTQTSFDWKQVGIGAALGFISGGFGAAAVGAKIGVKAGLLVADVVVSGAADFGLNVAAGSSVEEAGINAMQGALVGLATSGIGMNLSRNSRAFRISSNMERGGSRVPTVGRSPRDYDIIRRSGVQWHHIEIDDTRHLWATDMRTRHSDVATHPIANIGRRGSTSDVHIYTGVHGERHGHNWLRGIRKANLNEREFFVDDLVFQQHPNRNLNNRSVFVHDISNINQGEYTALLELPGHHVQAYCYSRNDRFLRRQFNLRRVTSYFKN